MGGTTTIHRKWEWMFESTFSISFHSQHSHARILQHNLLHFNCNQSCVFCLMLCSTFFIHSRACVISNIKTSICLREAKSVFPHIGKNSDFCYFQLHLTRLALRLVATARSVRWPLATSMAFWRRMQQRHRLRRLWGKYAASCPALSRPKWVAASP